MAVAPDRVQRRGTAPLLVALGVAVVAFGFQQTGVIPAIPQIQRDLHASQAWSAWLQTGYLIASCILTPLAGKLGDRMGKRRLLVASLGLFLVGSAGAAAAPSFPWLVAFRVVQGGGGAVFPLTLAIARDDLPDERVAGAIGLLTGTFGLGTAAGFAGGGALVQALGWRWLFVAGGAGVAVAALLVAVAVPRSRYRSEGGLDLLGGAFLTGGISLVLVGLTEGVSLGWGSPWIVGCFVAGAALLGAWVLHDLRVDEPLLDLRVLARRTVLLANLATMGLGFVLFAAYFLVPYLVQGSGKSGYGFAADTVQSGLFLLPAAIGQLVTGPLAPRLARPLSPKWVYALGLALAAIAAAGLAVAHGAAWLVVLWTLLVGAGAGLAIGIGSDLVAEAVDRAESGIATSLNSVLRRVGGGVGGQVAAALLAALAIDGVPTNGAFVTGFLAAAGAAAVGVALTLGIRSGA